MTEEQLKRFNEVYEENLQYIQGITPGDPLDPELVTVLRLLLKTRILLEGMNHAKDQNR